MVTFLKWWLKIVSSVKWFEYKPEKKNRATPTHFIIQVLFKIKSKIQGRFVEELGDSFET